MPILLIVVVGLAVVGLLVIVLAPWRTVRAEKRLPADVEARLLLGEPPAEVAESEAPAEPIAPRHVPPTAS